MQQNKGYISMKNFWKYLLIFLLISILITLFLLKTDKGHQKLGNFIENYLSNKTYNKIKVHYFNLVKYPDITIELEVNDKARIILKGTISNYHINMYYHLRGDAFSFNNFHLEDSIDVQGNLQGTFDSINVTGEGSLFDGDIKYQFINTPQEIKSLELTMRSVESKKILTFLEEKPFLQGLADINASFKSFSDYSKEGQVAIYIPNTTINSLKTLPFLFKSTINFNKTENYYNAEILSKELGTILIKNGKYQQLKHVALADYTIKIKNSPYLKKITHIAYKGDLSLNGNFIYNSYNQSFLIKGNTKEFNGNIDFIYNKNALDIKLQQVSLESLLDKFSYPILFTSKINGTINANIEEKIIIVNTHLNETRFVDSDFTNKVHKKAKINMISNSYDQSRFSAGYQNNKISSLLRIDNGKEYIELSQTKIDLKNNKINSKFKINMQNQEYYGTIYGTLSKPKFIIDKRKFLQYKTDQYLSGWLQTKE